MNFIVIEVLYHLLLHWEPLFVECVALYLPPFPDSSAHLLSIVFVSIKLAMICSLPYHCSKVDACNDYMNDYLL